MRAIGAAILTTALPVIVGQRFIDGLPIIQWSLGAVVGIILLALGGLFGGLAESPVLGAVLMLVVGWLVAPRLRWDAGRNTLSSGVWRVVMVLLGVGAALMIMSVFRPVASWDGWFTWSVKIKRPGADRLFPFTGVPVPQLQLLKSELSDSPCKVAGSGGPMTSGNLQISWPLQVGTGMALAREGGCAGDSDGPVTSEGSVPIAVGVGRHSPGRMVFDAKLRRRADGADAGIWCRRPVEEPARSASSRGGRCAPGRRRIDKIRRGTARSDHSLFNTRPPGKPDTGVRIRSCDRARRCAPLVHLLADAWPPR